MTKLCVSASRRALVRGLLASPFCLALAGPALSLAAPAAPAALAATGAADAGPASASGMSALTCLMSRRSVRSFTDAPVDEALIRQVLAAGMQAPSAGNQRPWQFVVVRERERLERLSKVHQYVRYAARARLGIVVCGDLEQEKLKGYWPLDVAACTQNILLAAHALGLGAVWTGIYPEEDRVRQVAEICSAPPHILPFALVVMGHPKASPPPQNRFAQERIHWETW